ncbi:dihydrolipoyl dehydrogenase [Gynuella sp.]|uniref:dihydrolipoyl dehydrogenase n=1 Tax=Gynuella sp. TaxID=2969146 RepID=UPI003D0C2260
MEQLHTHLAVIGSGPGGYSAAFRAADLGMEVTLIEKYGQLGGVCLNVGCIPSKALLHVAEQFNHLPLLKQWGITSTITAPDLNAIREHKNTIVKTMSQNIAAMSRQRRVNVITGEAAFIDDHHLQITQKDQQVRLGFDHAIIAVGSRPNMPDFLPHDARIMDSTAALQLTDIPDRMLVVGGGIIGLELGTVYQALGTRVTVIEFTDQLIPAADKDLVNLFQRSNKDLFNIRLNTRLTAVSAHSKGLTTTLLDADNQSDQLDFDTLLIAIGRTPNGHRVGAESAGVFVDQQGFIPVNNQLQTNVPHIYAIGDVTGNPMLAHRASHQAHTAAEVIAGHKVYFTPMAIPSIAYTQPEIAWTGKTEKDLKSAAIPYKVATFPWSALGRAHASQHTNGKTKLIYHPGTGQLLGAGVVGPHAGELIGELTLALEFGANIEDIGLTIHAHPTLHESIGLAAEAGLGTITDLFQPR